MIRTTDVSPQLQMTTTLTPEGVLMVQLTRCEAHPRRVATGALQLSTFLARAGPCVTAFCAVELCLIVAGAWADLRPSDDAVRQLVRRCLVADREARS